MSVKKSVFLTDLTAQWIEATTAGSPDSPAWSSAINATVEQLRYLLGQSLPDLTQEEWSALLNVYTGCHMPGHGLPARIASDIMDDAGALELSELTEERQTLVRKMHALNQTEQLAVLYFIQLFWSVDRNGQNWPGILSDIKAVMGVKP